MEKNNQQRIVSILRKGYGIHPERFFVLLDEALVEQEEIRAQIEKEAIRYGEADFIVISNGPHRFTDDDNIYTLNGITGQEQAFLEECATLHLRASEKIEPSDISTVLLHALSKEGFGRAENATLLAVHEGDTSEKVSFQTS